MNIQTIKPVAIATVLNLCLATAGAQADTDPSNLAFYKYQETRVATIEKTRSYMKRFLPKEETIGVEPTKDNIVRYVSESDVNTTLEHNLVSGDISFNRNFGRYIGDFAPKLPANERAVKYAIIFLEDNRLMPANPEELEVAHIGGLRSNAVLKGGEPGPIIDKLKTISFSRSLNGLPVIGAGSKLVVNIGDNGEVIGVIRRWRELSEPTHLKVSEVITEGEALKTLKSKLVEEFGEESQGEIMDIQLAYYDNNGSTIQPVYAFQTKIQLADLSLPPIDYMGVVPAMRKPIEDLNLSKVDERALKLIQSGNPAVPDEITKGND